MSFRPLGILAIEKTNCQPFCNIIANKNKEEKCDIYEDNYYELQLVKYELDKYKQLEEQIGCPLEVRCKMFCGLIVYNKKGEQLRIGSIYVDKFLANGFGHIYELKYEDHKKTWWLKADRSE